MDSEPAATAVKPEGADEEACTPAPPLAAPVETGGGDAEVKTASPGSDNTGDVKAESTATNVCSLCLAKKAIAGGCANSACRKCCLAHSDDCPVHQKSKKNTLVTAPLENSPLPDPAKTKKAVLKHEFKETNFAYYQETVTIFCVRDFFGSKRLSQGILNDQTRSQRVSGSYLGKQPARIKGVRSPELKAAIMDVLGKRKRLEGEKDATVARSTPVEAASG